MIIPSALIYLVLSAGPAPTGNWSQFRGAGGVAVGSGSLPTEIGPDQYVVWKTPLPLGHSSPVVHGPRIYLTGVENKKLYTLALDRATGKELWRREAPYRTLEKIHTIGSHAQATAVTDGTHVVVFFGAAGMFCYDRDGNPL